jgi:hypothetical protein
MRGGIDALRVTVLALVLARSATAQSACSAPADGNPCTLSVSVRLSTLQAAELGVSAQSVTFPPASGADLDVGAMAVPGPSAFVRANSAWLLMLSATTGVWQHDGTDSRADKPVTDLQWGTSSSGPFTDLTQMSSTISSGTAGAGSAGEGFQSTLYLRTKLGWTDPPGQYSLTVYYTLTAP